MIGRRLTYRTVDGVRIPGTWRHVFIRNGRYFLTDLRIYADGLIDCWGLVTLEEFEEKVRTGWVATTLPDGAQASAHGLARWTFSEPRSLLTPEMLVAEVRDTIDRLNQRPDSIGRCLAAVDAFLADRTEENRAAAHAAFLAVPASRRRYVLGDMDTKDWPLRVLVAGPGGRTYLPSDPPVSQESYDRALAYFEERTRWSTERGTYVPADGPAAPHAPAVRLSHSLSNEPVADPGHLGLRNDYPAPISVGEVVYPSVAHAYWALSVTRPESRSAIAAADTAAAAHKLAAATARRENWEHVRAAVMTRLLRAKYDQHPELAEILLATDGATVVYDDVDSAFWGDNAGRGRNWTGRLLELVRSELRMRQNGIPGL
ncbi:NADAR family protein [Streptomyces sp. Je 1-79]|uniref:NADAR family protein n=1 Tax=Streptomyces sp. Je 1-79 TaxID=2943847 RepID=UPI0021A579CA|nr:NADAR family protein [Streptomyces sp. Je 1-79]MCT4353450.1 NADAR family protein [Streptomyces sp. Je 1-79]